MFSEDWLGLVIIYRLHQLCFLIKLSATPQNCYLDLDFYLALSESMCFENSLCSVDC